uniref:Uncharacterized protein n=1 Tax=Larimichthys crocea TaxID=215358 RepID=A0A0F8AQ98_LARCR
MSRTPQPSDEVSYLMSGLGRRNVSMSEDSGHTQVSEACDGIPEENATCPVCSCVFSSATIEMHASMCGER